MARSRLSVMRAIVLVLACQAAVAKTDAPNQAAASQKSANIDSGQIGDEPLGGIVINRTMTVLGWDFYKSFTEVWQAVHPDSKFTLTVTERPTAQYGSEIWVSYRDIRIFHTFLSPARSSVGETSKQAVEIAYKNVVAIEEQRKSFKSADLGPEEM